MTFVTYTNQKVRKFIADLDPSIAEVNKYSFYSETTESEIRVLIGMMYARILLGQSFRDVDILFGDKCGHPIYGVTMGSKHFKFLKAKIMFDDEDTRKDRWKSDRFAAFRKIFESFIRNCGQTLAPDDFVNIDESLYPTRNRISFKQYNPNKPAKYGILFKSLNAARYPYTFTASVYSGKPEGNPSKYYISGIEAHVQYLVNNLI